MSCSVKEVPLFDSQTVHAELFFASSLDRHQLGPKVSPKLADARKMKRLADLALLAGSPLDAAKHAALASTELRALDDAQWYAGALCTWCAAVLGCIEVGNEDGSFRSFARYGFPHSRDKTSTRSTVVFCLHPPSQRNSTRFGAHRAPY